MRICLVFVLLSLSASPTIQAASVESSESSGKISWLDQRHQQVSNSGDRLAGWVDAFFSSSRSVEEAASSILRIRPQYDWDEDDDDWKLRVTGRLYLPAASDRLSLVFLGENEDDFDTEFYDPAMAADGQSTIGLQYRLTEERHSRIDLTAGLKSGPKGKIGAKYRYQLPFGQRNRFRFSEELFWIGGDGFGTLTRIDFDHALSDDTLLRWANKAEYSEESNGVESRAAGVRFHERGNGSALSEITRAGCGLPPPVLAALAVLGSRTPLSVAQGARGRFTRRYLWCRSAP
jgi:hypothetical protein